MTSFNFNIWNILIISAVLHGLLFSIVVLFKKKYRNKVLLFLILTILSFCFNNLYYWFIDTKLDHQFPWLTYIFVSYDLLVGAFFYLFVKGYLQKKASKKLLAILFIPFIVSSTLQFLFYSELLSSKYVSVYETFFEYFSILFNASLTVLFFIEIYNYEKQSKLFSKTKVIIKTKWLKHSLTIGFILCLLWAIGIQSFGDSLTGFTRYYPLWIGISLFIYWIAYSSIFHTTIFKQQLDIRKNTKPQPLEIERTTPTEAASKKKINTDLFNKIEGVIEAEKLYLNSQISLNLIAAKLNISANYVSQIINNHAKLSFPDYINTKRVSLAKEVLVNPDFNNYTIQSIAFETGFNSKSSFYSAFKKETQLTPSQFKQSFKTEMISIA